MATNCPDNDSPVAPLKSESARKRWEMFHRAIAHAKQSTAHSLNDEDGPAGDGPSGGPVLTVVR